MAKTVYEREMRKGAPGCRYQSIFESTLTFKLQIKKKMNYISTGWNKLLVCMK